MSRDISDTSEPTPGGTSRTYELLGVDEAEIRNIRIKHLVNEKWRDGLGKIIADVIGEPKDDVASVLGLNDTPGVIVATLSGGEHSDIEVMIELFEGTDEGKDLHGMVMARAGNIAVQSAVEIYEEKGVAVDEIMLALSGEDENLFATGVIKENPEQNGGLTLVVTSEWDPISAK